MTRPPSGEALQAYRLARLALLVSLGAIAYCTGHDYAATLIP